MLLYKPRIPLREGVRGSLKTSAAQYARASATYPREKFVPPEDIEPNEEHSCIETVLICGPEERRRESAQEDQGYDASDGSYEQESSPAVLVDIESSPGVANDREGRPASVEEQRLESE